MLNSILRYLLLCLALSASAFASSNQDHYGTLGVSHNATDREIKMAYRSLAKRFHPDKHPANHQEAEERFKRINQAYEILRDPETRAHYDQNLQSSALTTPATDSPPSRGLDLSNVSRDYWSSPPQHQAAILFTLDQTIANDESLALLFSIDDLFVDLLLEILKEGPKEGRAPVHSEVMTLALRYSATYLDNSRFLAGLHAILADPQWSYAHSRVDQLLGRHSSGGAGCQGLFEL